MFKLAVALQVRALQVQYLGKSAAPHAFRGMQVRALRLSVCVCVL